MLKFNINGLVRREVIFFIKFKLFFYFDKLFDVENLKYLVLKNCCGVVKVEKSYYLVKVKIFGVWEMVVFRYI